MADEQKIAFITGANRCIGFETARELGQAGVTVVLGVRDLEKGKDAAAKLREQGITADAIAYDAANSSAPQNVYNYLNERYGKLDILINNAGISREPLFGGPTVTTISPEDLRGTFDTNFFAVVALTQTLLPLIEKSPAGRIVNLSSILGSLTLHSTPNSPIESVKGFGYNSSKAALNAFTIHLAHALKDTPIKVNSAHPGWVKTELGGDAAPMELSEGGKTSAQLALLGPDGPTGGYFHLGETLPW